VQARLFNVEQIGTPGLIQNFFSTAVADAAACMMKKRDLHEAHENALSLANPMRVKREFLEAEQTEQCVNYLCSSTDGCYVTFTCAPGCNQCMIGGTCYRAFDQNPAAQTNPTQHGCDFCIPSKSTTQWSQCTGPGNASDPCSTYSCLADFASCGLKQVCTPECNRCQIGKNCYDSGWLNSADNCLACDPTQNATGWSQTCQVCTPACKNGASCDGHPPACNCTLTDFDGPACDVPVTCDPPCENGGKCRRGNICVCEGTHHDGPTCGNCVGVCSNLTCSVDCLHGGICNPSTGSCSCAGTGYNGARCDVLIPTTTTAPTTSGTTVIQGTATTALTPAACEMLCVKMCAPASFSSCMCDPNTRQVTVTCNQAPASAPATTMMQAVVKASATTIIVSTLLVAIGVVLALL